MDQIVEYSQEVVDRFLRSKGWDPKHIDRNRRMAFTKTKEFQMYAARMESVEPVVEMDKSQDPPGRDDQNYDYGKGKWSRAKAVSSKKATSLAHDILKKSFSNNKSKKNIEEQEPTSPTMKNRPYTKGLAQSRAHTKDMALKRSVHVNKPQLPVKTEAMEFPGDDGIKPQGSSSRVAGESCGCKHSKKEMSKSARIIKSIYKKKGLKKEELYDHEKDSKEPATYGKAPKVSVGKKQIGDEKSAAAAVLSGGTTLTGQKRDDVLIDPVMKKSKPGSPNSLAGDSK